MINWQTKQFTKYVITNQNFVPMYRSGSYEHADDPEREIIE